MTRTQVRRFIDALFDAHGGRAGSLTLSTLAAIFADGDEWLPDDELRLSPIPDARHPCGCLDRRAMGAASLGPAARRLSLPADLHAAYKIAAAGDSAAVLLVFEEPLPELDVAGARRPVCSLVLEPSLVSLRHAGGEESFRPEGD